MSSFKGFARNVGNPAIATRLKNQNTVFKAVIDLFKEKRNSVKEKQDSTIPEIHSRLESEGFKISIRTVERHLIELMNEDYVVIHRKRKNEKTGKRVSVYRPNYPTYYKMTPEQRLFYKDSDRICNEFTNLGLTVTKDKLRGKYYEAALEIYENTLAAKELTKQYRESWITGKSGMNIGEREFVFQQRKHLSKEQKADIDRYRDVDDHFVYTFFGHFLVGLTLEIL